MKKFITIFLAAAVLLLAAGIGCCAAGAVMGASWEDLDLISRIRDSSNIMDIGILESEAQDGEHIKTTLEDLRELDIDIQNGTLRIETSEDGTTHMEAWGYLNRFEWELEDDGTLVIEDRSRSLDQYKKEIVLYVPEGHTFTEADIDVGTGTGEIHGISVTGEALFDVGAGTLTIDNFTGGDLIINCGVGNFTLSGTVKGNINADCGIGKTKLHLTNDEKDFNYDLDCGIGSIDLNGDSYSSLGADRQIDNHAAYDFDLDCGIGSISVEFEN